MESLLFRTGSGSTPFQNLQTHASRRRSVSLSVHHSAAGVFSGENNGASSPRISLNTKMSLQNILRSSSESDITRSETRTVSKLGSRSFAALRIPEHQCGDGIGFAGDWAEIGDPEGGMNSHWKSGGGGSGGNGSDSDRHKIGAYYEEMLKSNPTSSLLLRNYGKYLHEVEKDVVKAEAYYGRAILAEPGDGEVLSLYGKLIWETHRDEGRAKSYFDQALNASPQDCMVLGSYAHFMWEQEDEEDEEMERGIEDAVPFAEMAEAF